jgi:DnaJ family protein A protein 5
VQGFYTIYRELFDLIVKDEMLATPYPGEAPFAGEAPIYPSFGFSTSSYDAETNGVPPVKQFYAVFASNFASRKSFAAFDEYKTTEAPDRRYKRRASVCCARTGLIQSRAMEKANRAAREEARQEYNDTVRVSYLTSRSDS